MGTPEAMQAVEARVHPGRTGGRLQVTIIGGGDVGFQLAERLEQIPSIDLRILERGAERGAVLAASLSRTLVLNGDGTDLEFLESENVGRSDVLVSVIDNDERNLLASLLGRQLGVPKVITRVGRPANLRLFERVGIDVAISARGAAVASILHQITGGATSLLAVIEHGEARVFELTVNADVRAAAAQADGHRGGCDRRRHPARRAGNRAAGRRASSTRAIACSSSPHRKQRIACASTSRARQAEPATRPSRCATPWSSTCAARWSAYFSAMFLAPLAVALYYREYTDAVGFAVAAVDQRSARTVDAAGRRHLRRGSGRAACAASRAWRWYRRCG